MRVHAAFNREKDTACGIPASWGAEGGRPGEIEAGRNENALFDYGKGKKGIGRH